MKKGITAGRINRFFGIVLGIFLVIIGFLYWQNRITEIGLITVILVVLATGGLFVFGVRIAQKDGFFDGYIRAKDELNKKKKA